MTTTEPRTNKPATTAEKLAELREKLALAADPGDEKAKARRDKKGILSARSRIHALVDPGSFLEIGALARTPGDPNAFYGDGVVTGHGTINGRPVGVFSHDQTVFPGSVGEMFGRKAAPADGVGGHGRLPDHRYQRLGRRTHPGHRDVAGLVRRAGPPPRAAARTGARDIADLRSAPAAVYSPIQTDLARLFVIRATCSSPALDVIKDVTGEDVTLDELGGADAQACYGNIHQVVESEAAAFQYVRDHLSFLPANAFDDAPVVNPGPSRRSPRMTSSWTRSCRTRTTWPTTCTRSCCGIFDDGDVFEVGQHAGPAILTAFARVDGIPSV